MLRFDPATLQIGSIWRSAKPSHSRTNPFFNDGRVYRILTYIGPVNYPKGMHRYEMLLCYPDGTLIDKTEARKHDYAAKMNYFIEDVVRLFELYPPAPSGDVYVGI